jgi:hypothetical protein
MEAGLRIMVSLQANLLEQQYLVNLDYTHNSSVKATQLISPLSKGSHTCNYSSSKLKQSHLNCKALYSQGNLKLRKCQLPSFVTFKGFTLSCGRRNHPSERCVGCFEPNPYCSALKANFAR